MTRIDGEDAEVMRRGGLEWRRSTINRWHLKIGGIYVAEVARPLSWRRLQLPKPWRVSVFGSMHEVPNDEQEHRTLDLATAAAERVMRARVFALYAVLTRRLQPADRVDGNTTLDQLQALVLALPRSAHRSAVDLDIWVDDAGWHAKSGSIGSGTCASLPEAVGSALEERVSFDKRCGR